VGSLEPPRRSYDIEDVVGAGLGLLVRGAMSVVRRLPPPVVAAGARALFSKSWRTFQAACADPRGAQERRLAGILARNADTAFGREHGFGAIRNLEAYRQQVPVRAWAEVLPYVRREVAGERNVLCGEEVFFFARSSGTTGEPKHVPVTQSYLEEFRHGRRVWARQVAQVMPGCMRGHFLTVHSPSVEGFTPGGTPCGSITVAMGSGREDPSGFDTVPRDVFRLPDHAARYYLALRFALQRPVSLLGAINPSTLVLLGEVLARHAGELANDVERGGLWDGVAVPEAWRGRLLPRLRRDRAAAERLRRSVGQHGVARFSDVWPRLAGLLCWKGGSAPFYLDRLAALAPGLPTMDYGYTASEGNFTVPLDGGSGQGVALAGGHVLEFIPLPAYESGSREALSMESLEEGGRYVVVVTGSHGLYRYDMQDVVEVRGWSGRAPLLAFLHKTGNMVSVTGEKVAESHVVEAMTRAMEVTGVRVRGFCVAPEMVMPPRYVVAVEPDGVLAAEGEGALLRAWEEAMRAVNVEYRAKRESLRLGEPVVRQVPGGAFERHRAGRVAAGAPDSHVKAPHLSRTLAVVEDLARLPGT
jgi:hypothetical protein